MKLQERDSADRRRRERERQMVEEGLAMWHQHLQEQCLQKIREQNEVRELMVTYKPWGRPGAGAPAENVRKKKFLDWQLSTGSPVSDSSDLSKDVMAMGRPGYGAPLRTRSGRLRTQLRCDPALRFQAAATGNSKAVDSTLRYYMTPEEQETYRKELDVIVNVKKKIMEHEKQLASESDEGLWEKLGKPGPGGTPWRIKKLQQNSLYQMLGWNLALDPRQRFSREKYQREYTEDDKTRWSDRKRRPTVSSMSEGIELVPLLQSKKVGKPRRDSRTGELLTNALPHSDITASVQLRPNVLPEERNIYRQILGRQLETQQEQRQKIRQLDEESTKRHYETWESFWGRPGHGAPCKGHIQREKLFHLLHQSQLGEIPKT